MAGRRGGGRIQRSAARFEVGQGAEIPARRIHLAAGLLAVALAAAGTSFGAQVDSVTVTHHGASFRISLDAVVDAPQRRVYAVLTDYTRLAELNPAISKIGVRRSPSGRGERVRSELQSCVWFFCRRLVQVEDVEEPDPYTIAARIVPGEGDFQSGSCFWRVTGEAGGTRLHYEAVRVVGFWVPPLIGPWAIERALRAQLTSSIGLLERLANR